MTPVSQDEPGVNEPGVNGPGIEDPYENLFRPVEPEIAEVKLEVEVEQPSPATPAPSETGRVFKSLGVAGHEEALVAVPLHKAGKLRTLTRDDKHNTNVIPVSTSAVAVDEVREETSPRVRTERSTHARSTSARPEFIGSLSALWVYAITIAVTLIFSLGDVLIFGGLPGFLSGLGLFLATIFVSFAVKQSDDIHVIYAPAIAFFLMAITVGQINVTANSFLDRLIEVFFILGGNWIWILGSTAFALTVVAIRRRSLR